MRKSLVLGLFLLLNMGQEGSCASPLELPPATMGQEGSCASLLEIPPATVAGLAQTNTTNTPPVVEDARTTLVITPAQGAKKIQDESGLEFTLPGEFRPRIEPDGELQLSASNGDFVAVDSNGTADETLTAMLGSMKTIGKESFKQESNPKVTEKDGVRITRLTGTMELRGDRMEWSITIYDAGKKALSFACLGPSVHSDEEVEALLNSVKKQQN